MNGFYLLLNDSWFGMTHWIIGVVLFFTFVALLIVHTPLQWKNMAQDFFGHDLDGWKISFLIMTVAVFIGLAWVAAWTGPEFTVVAAFYFASRKMLEAISVLIAVLYWFSLISLKFIFFPKYRKRLREEKWLTRYESLFAKVLIQRQECLLL